jgi:hypothetical protein
MLEIAGAVKPKSGGVAVDDPTVMMHEDCVRSLIQQSPIELFFFARGFSPGSGSGILTLF